MRSATDELRLRTKTPWLRLLAGDKVAFSAAVVLVAIALLTFVLPAVVHVDATGSHLTQSLVAPFGGGGFENLLGTNVLGQHEIARLLVGGRTSLSIAVGAAILAAVVGFALGIAAGYIGGFVDAVLMRLADVILGFPTLLLAVVFLYLGHTGIVDLILILSVSRLPLYLRIARADTLKGRYALHVDAARCQGATSLQIARYDILPALLPTGLTMVALDIGLLMLMESALSFLGIGVQSPAISWGLMVADGRNYVSSAWWLSVFPGAAIFVVAISTNLLSNWVRTAMEPRERWRLEIARGKTLAQESVQ